MKPKIIFTGIVLVLFALFGGSQKELNEILSLIDTVAPTVTPSQTLGANDQQTYLVTKVIDGDTIELESGQKVRYIGIDTPELKGSECFAKEARDKNKELVEGKRVKLQKDVSETDRYGRLLRFVYTEDDTLINDTLIKEGYATVSTYPPDVAKQKLFQQSQQEARTNNRGLWKGC